MRGGKKTTQKETQYLRKGTETGETETDGGKKDEERTRGRREDWS